MSNDNTPPPLPSDLLVDLLDLARDAIILRDAADRIVFWNGGAAALYGWSREEALGQVTHELLRTRFPHSREAALEALRRDGRWEGLLRQVARDGRELVTASRWSARRVDGGPDTMVVLEANRDVTEERRLVEQLRQQAVELEQQLEESQSLSEELEQATEELVERTTTAEAAERRLSLVLDSLPDAALLYDGDWRILYVNPAGAAAVRAAGGDPVAVIGHVVWDAFPELVGGRLHREALRAVAERVPVTYDERSARDGRWYEIRIVPTPEGAAVFQRDITDEYRAEAERAQRAAIVEASEDAIISKDLDGTILSWNAAATRIFGYEAHEVIGKSILIITPPDRHHEEPEILARLRRGERIEHFETVRRRKDGTLIDVSLSISPVRDHTGAVASIAKIARDITAQKRAADDIARAYAAERQAREAAEAANRAKVEFLATMSHELRTPLNAIAGYAELLAMGVRGPVTEEQREDLLRIQRSQQHLLGLINDVLNFARLDAKHVHYNIGDVPVGAMLERVEDLILPQLRGKGVRYHRPPCDPALAVRADAEKVRQVVVNLLSNAIKFTPPGGRIDVACETTEGAVQIRVRDTGIGIPPERLTDIFEPFVQIGRHLNRPAKGVGLGLAISRELARAMGGELTAESELGAGSTFTLSLPRGGGRVAAGG